MGSAMRKSPPLLAAYEIEPQQLLFEKLYVDVREALQKITNPADASVACVALKHFFRKAAQLSEDTSAEKVEFLTSVEEVLREIEAKLCDGKGGGEDREEGREGLARALARLEELRESYVDCISCSRVINDYRVGCADKARYPPYQACMDKERKRRRIISECGARPHLFDPGFSVGGRSGEAKNKRACLVERGVLAE